MEQRPDREPEVPRERPGEQGAPLPERSRDRRSGADDLGIDVEAMNPRAQVVASVSVLFLFTSFWWLIFFFGWAIFPAFGLFLRGIAGLSEGEGGRGLRGSNDKERELLGTLREHEEITPTQASMETSLTVEEADGMLRELAAEGHLDVRVRGGGIFYGLWRAEDAEKRGSRRGFRCRGGGRSCYHSLPGRGFGA